MPPSEAKTKWARAFPGAVVSGASSPTTNAGAPAPAANTATAAFIPKGKAAKGPKELSGESVMVLVDGLTYLASPSFLEGTYKPENLARSGESSIDDALSRAATVVSVWNDPSHLSLAVKTWPATEKSLKALLTQAGQQGLDAGMLKNARQAVDKITKYLGIRVAKEKAAKSAKPLAVESLEVLVNNLDYLANRSFLQGGYKPKPLASSGERSIDEALGQAAQTVTLWNDPATLPKAREYWREAERRLYALLAQAAEHGFDSAKLNTARQAVENITKYLGIRLAQGKIAEAEKEIETPDVNEDFDIRELKKLEPSLNLLRTANKQLGRLAAQDSNLKKLSKVIEIYYSVDDWSAKLKAFKNAGLVTQVATVADLTAGIAGIMRDAAEAYTKGALVLAEKAGESAAVKTLNGTLKALKQVKGVLAVYSLVKSTVELANAIEKGDWHAVASSGFSVVSAGIGVAEATGAVGGTGAAAATGVAFIIWVEVDIIISVAELNKWAKEYTALQAVKKLIADTKAIVPAGRKMAAAAQLLLDAQGAAPDVNQDRAGVAQIDAYERQATQLAGLVAKALKVLAGNHFMRSDLDSVGGYPPLMHALGDPAKRAIDEAFMGIDPNPLSVTQAFESIVHGIKSVAAQGNKLYGDAGG